MIYDLVFEGGGAKGMVFAGAVAELEQHGHQFGRLLGTSAGAITATLLAAGYDGNGLLATLTEKHEGNSVFSSFLGVPQITDSDLQRSVLHDILQSIDIPFIPDTWEKPLDQQLERTIMYNKLFRHLFSFIELGGWYASHRVPEWMRLRLNSGEYKGKPRNFGDLNMRQFYEKTGVDLSLIASDTTHQALLILNHRTAPDLPIVHAVHMSMSIPLLWQEQVWKE
jgi:predicted acylesterase/phospholipase RssA